MPDSSPRTFAPEVWYSNNEPPHLPMSHHISQWATTSPNEPQHLFWAMHHISKWATPCQWAISSSMSHLICFCKEHLDSLTYSLTYLLTYLRTYCWPYSGLLYTTVSLNRFYIDMLRNLKLVAKPSIFLQQGENWTLAALAIEMK